MLYIPILGGSDMTFEAYAIDYRFCSFGSNWNNKVSRGKFPLKIMIEGGFCQVDLANIIIGHDKRLKFSNGFLIKATHTENCYCALFTGDSMLNPPILEVKYER